MCDPTNAKEKSQYSSLAPLTWELINSLESNCYGRVATVFEKNHSSFDDAVDAGAVYWGNHHITSKDQLAGVLVGFELSNNGSAAKPDIYFLKDDKKSNKKGFESNKVFEIDLEDASDNGEFTKAQLTISNQGIAIVFDGHSDYVSEDDKGQPLWIERNDGEIHVVVFDDINNEEPTHVISLEGARNTARREG